MYIGSRFATDQETTVISAGLTPIKENSVFYSRMKKGYC